MARLYANENFPLSAVEALRRFGYDAPTTADNGTDCKRRKLCRPPLGQSHCTAEKFVAVEGKADCKSKSSALDKPVHLAAIDCDMVLRDVYAKGQITGSDGRPRLTQAWRRHRECAAHAYEVSDALARLPLPQSNGIAVCMRPNTQWED
jgi:hypothetical protein